ncbi:hypothetical protein TorRG33x02_054970 [Trema orientale]|uniref:RNase H type-1 domain-containing protein n=1 Tax=Trema orientale TaxID=63057 RepID=A0A2P5FLC1_TREOI|nr:hypothetical protein TorRG33x02_054970 [Trema orientale]
MVEGPLASQHLLENQGVSLESFPCHYTNCCDSAPQRNPMFAEESAGHFLHEFQQAHLKVDGASLLKIHLVHNKWKCLPAGQLKLNVDTTIDSRSNSIGVGEVLKDNNGNVIDALYKRFCLIRSPYVAELLAMKEVLSWCKYKSYTAHMLECDCLSAVMAVNTKLGLSTEDILIGDIQSLFMDYQVGSCSYVARESNTVAHTLVKLCFKDDFIFFGFDDILRCIAHCVASDLG